MNEERGISGIEQLNDNQDNKLNDDEDQASGLDDSYEDNKVDDQYGADDDQAGADDDDDDVDQAGQGGADDDEDQTSDLKYVHL